MHTAGRLLLSGDGLGPFVDLDVAVTAQLCHFLCKDNKECQYIRPCLLTHLMTHNYFIDNFFVRDKINVGSF